MSQFVAGITIYPVDIGDILGSSFCSFLHIRKRDSFRIVIDSSRRFHVVLEMYQQIVGRCNVHGVIAGTVEVGVVQIL
jgi:hypothetical protein